MPEFPRSAICVPYPPCLQSHISPPPLPFISPNSKPRGNGGRALIETDAYGERSPSPEVSGEEHDEFVDAFDTIDDGWVSDGGSRTPRASISAIGGLALSPVFEQMANSPFHDLSPQEQVAKVEQDGGIPYELCRDPWSQELHVRRINELLNATKERVAREKNVDRAAANTARRRMSLQEDDPPEMSMYDQAKGVVGRMQMGQDITKFELPATFLTPFSAIQASEDVLTIIAGTERSDKEWRDMSDTTTCDTEQRFLNVLKLFLDMESLRCEEGTSGGTKSSFTMPPMKKPINSVLGETHRTRVGDVEMVAEQVSHHPPITCWEVEHSVAGLQVTGNLSPKPIFHGTSVQVALRGTLLYEFEATGETYLASIPDLYIRFFGLGGGYNENVGKVRFERVSGGNTGDETKLWADLHFKPRGSAGWKSKAHRMDCTVYRDLGNGGRSGSGGSSNTGSSAGSNPTSSGSSTGGVVGLGYGFLENFGDKTSAEFTLAKASSVKWCAKNFIEGSAGADVEALYTLKGHYNTEIRNLATGETFWRTAKRKKQNPVAATVPIDLETESHLVWGDLICSIVREDWKKANIAKKRVETAQRVLMKEIKEGRKKWVPRLFSKGQKTHLGIVKNMYTLKQGVRRNPPECDPDWHELVGKAVFEDL